jgi:hypothetical protein
MKLEIALQRPQDLQLDFTQRQMDPCPRARRLKKQKNTVA